ncbi:uncharacterized protein V1518DRAFT_417286, partial [Limtongia smithiae]|uniref:uncharacterized protein n=1 Tax=Limtongia smithiae TaxID=1125753 RepID=UPI0034CE6374
MQKQFCFPFLSPRVSSSVCLWFEIDAPDGLNLDSLGAECERVCGAFRLRNSAFAVRRVGFSGRGSAPRFLLHQAAMKIADRTFVVSGGVSGLGRATTAALLGHGAHVAVFDRDGPPTPPTSTAVRYYTVDVTDPAALETAVDEVVRWCSSTEKHLGGVVCAAGVAWAEKALDRAGAPASLALFRTVVDINLLGTYHLATLVASRLYTSLPASLLSATPDSERGVIILVASVAAFEGQKGQTAYAASKGAIASLTLPLARDLASFGIRVNCIAPGVFSTEMSTGMSKKAVERITEMLEFPARFGRPHEFAEMVIALVGNGIMNGAVVRMDGASRMGKL